MIPYQWCCQKTVGGWPLYLLQRATSGPLMQKRKGAVKMVTYSDLFQYTLVIVAIVSLIIKVCKKK